jgi:signal transduction histidine kinase
VSHRIHFTVDAALLSELGERLVGKPHIALAELIKNAYDADARRVEIIFDKDSIQVIDDGHGMSLEAFEDFWMRIGSPHKAKRRYSPRYKRPLTGSKGVGRLAAQFLASRLTLVTRAENGGPCLSAEVDWRDAVLSHDLTEASALVDEDAPLQPFAEASPHGTQLTLSGLHQDWGADRLKALARELWPLQPPFGTPDEARDFRVTLVSHDEEAASDFEAQMSAVLDLWSARIVASVRQERDAKHVDVDLTFSDDEHYAADLELKLKHLDAVSFEIRIFSLHRRQRFGIQVEEARRYIREYGGVHIYDAGFHLPYYGPTTDWLDIERDHAHRLAQSKLLPKELHVPGGLEYLPTNARIYGVVEVDTGHERHVAELTKRPVRDALSIQVSRDRLISNEAYEELRRVVRSAIDFYATRESIRAARASTEVSSGQLLEQQSVGFVELVETVRSEIPDPVYQTLRRGAEEVRETAQTEAEAIAQQASVLGSLATAGIAALALEHEAARQLQILEKLAGELELSRDASTRQTATQLRAWLERARATRRIFAPMMDSRNREERHPFRARVLLEQVFEQIRPLVPGVQFDADAVPEDLRLPIGTFAEWSAVFQNVFANAANATVDNRAERVISCTGESSGSGGCIRVLDNGRGFPLDRQDELFRPFGREQELSSAARSLHLGGTGLGLTIVRMLTNRLHTRASFEAPPVGFNTMLQIEWKAAS